MPELWLLVCSPLVLASLMIGVQEWRLKRKNRQIPYSG